MKMAACAAQSTWTSYFNENIDDSGLPVPTGLYSGAVAALGSWRGITAMIERFGSRTTVSELVGAGARADFEVVARSFLAAGYVGALIGNAGVATARHLACGTRLIDMIGHAQKNFPNAPWVVTHFVKYPEIHTIDDRNRSSYAVRVRRAS